MRPDLSTLISRLQELKEPSREVDALIRCALLVADTEAYVVQSPLNGAWCIYKGEWQGRPRLYEPPRSMPNDLWRGEYTASLDAAIALCHRVLPERSQWWSILKDAMDLQGWMNAYNKGDRVQPEDLPRYVCIAVLSALAASPLASTETGG